MNKRAFSPVEEIIVLVIISIFINILYHRYEIILFKAKTEETKIDLYNLNLVVKLFRIQKGKYPSTLYNLYKQGRLKNILQKSILKNRRVVDPFGNPYIYDNKTGVVSLSRKTYKLIYEKH